MDSLLALDEKVDDSGEVLTCLEELLGGEVFLEGVDVCHDSLFVEKEVLGNFGSKLVDILELNGPILD